MHNNAGQRGKNGKDAIKNQRQHDGVNGTTVQCQTTREWITSVQKFLQTHGAVWMEDSKEEQLSEPEMTPKLRDMLDSSVKLVPENDLTIEAKVRVGVHHKSFPIDWLLEE